MTDRYATFAHSGAGRFLVNRLGLPDPPRLRRYEKAAELGPVTLAGEGRGGGLGGWRGKEGGGGAAAQVVDVAPGAEEATESTLRFLLSGRSAYVSGQVIRIGPAAVDVPDDWDQPLVGKTAIVTGAA